MTPTIRAFTIGRLPRITFGPGSIAEVPAAVARHGRSALVLTGRSFAGSSRWATLEERLGSHGVGVSHALVPTGEPSPATVDALVAAFRGTGVDVVVGIGGGSVLDTSKALAGLLRARTSVVDHLEGAPGQQPYEGPAIPWIAVPTTAGTGSEATRNAVFTAPGPSAAKRSFRDERLVAAEAIVDPDLLVGLSPETIAANGADAVTQLLESYTSTRAGPLTDALALEGLRAAATALPRWHAAVRGGGDDPAARAAMAYAALLSGICLAQAGLGVVHGLVAPLGARIPVSHGAGCGALLAAGVATNLRALDAGRGGPEALDRYAVLARVLVPDSAGNPSDVAARAGLVSWLGSLVAELGIPRLAAFGLTDEDAGIVAGQARTSSSMRTNPVELTDAELIEILVDSR